MHGGEYGELHSTLFKVARPSIFVHLPPSNLLDLVDKFIFIVKPL